MSNQEQAAREMAERCVDKLIDGDENTLPDDKSMVDVILRELKLVALLEDKARYQKVRAIYPDLMRLKNSYAAVWMRDERNGIKQTSYTSGDVNVLLVGKILNAVDAAITNAMKQEEGK